MGREEILRRFEEWLDHTLAAEEPPRGVEAEFLTAVVRDNEDGGAGDAPSADYSLWAAVTALTQEVKLQGRSFKELNETLGSQATRMAQREREVAIETERRCRKEILSVLIDLRDRLVRGLESVRVSETEDSRAAGQGWLTRVFSRPAENSAGASLAALKRGYELGLQRLDQTLAEYNVREIPCAGKEFDPRRMNAIERQESAAVPEGTVIEVYRSGYEWNGEVFRPAQVKVSCVPAGKDDE